MAIRNSTDYMELSDINNINKYIQIDIEKLIIILFYITLLFHIYLVLIIR